MDLRTLAVFAGLIAVFLFLTSFQSSDYPTLDISKFDSYAKIPVSSSGTYRLYVPLSLLDANDINTLYVGTIYDGRMVVLPYSIVPTTDGHYIFFYTPRDDNHYIYIFLHPDDNSTMRTDLRNVFRPREVASDELSVHDTGYRYYTYSIRYDPNRDELLVVLYEESTDYTINRSAMYKFIVYNPADLSVKYEYSSVPANGSVLVVGRLRSVSYIGSDRYSIGFVAHYIVNNSYYTTNFMKHILCSPSGSCTEESYPRTSSVMAVSYLYDSSVPNDYSVYGEYRYLGYVTRYRVPVSSISYYTYNYCINAGPDLCDNHIKDVWCNNGVCWFTVESIHGFTYNSGVPIWILAKHTTTTGPVKVRTIYDSLGPSDYDSYRIPYGQLYNDGTIYYDGYRIVGNNVYLDPNSAGVFVHHKYLGATKIYIDGKSYPLNGYASYASDGNYFYSVLFSSDKTSARVIKWTWDYYELDIADLSFEPISLGTVIVDPVPQLSTYLRLSGVVSLETPGTYILSISVDGNLVYETNIDVQDTTPFTLETNISVPYFTSLPVTVTVHDGVTVYAYTEENLTFYPASPYNIPSQFTAYLNRENTLALTYLTVPEANSELVLDFNDYSVTLTPACESFPNYNLCTTTYTFAPSDMTSFDINVYVLVTVDQNTYEVPLGAITVTVTALSSGGGYYSPPVEQNTTDEIVTTEQPPEPSHLSAVPIDTAYIAGLIIVLVVFYFIIRSR